MPRTILILGLAGFLSGRAFPQAAVPPTFEVASIRPSGEQASETKIAGVRIDGAQFRTGSMTLKDYIGMAYRVRLFQISGPDWLASERFDITATLPPGNWTTEWTEMLRALLEERFQMKTHRDKKELPVYALEVAKSGLKMQENPPDPDAGNADRKEPVSATGAGSPQGVAVNLPGGASYTFSSNRFEARKITMSALAPNLERFVDRPIVDMTELKGNYNFSLEVTEEDYRSMMMRAAVNAGVNLPPAALRLLDSGSPVSLFDALQKLGLRLEARKAPLDLLVIDEARKAPTEN